LFVPRGFAHGFVVLSETAIFAYKVDNYYSPECDCGLAFDDASLNINWQLAKEQLKLSEKDLKQPDLVGLGLCFEYDVDYYA
jgi:dTDP-4-dehydrorhamnose 3,5-epimerase